MILYRLRANGQLLLQGIPIPPINTVHQDTPEILLKITIIVNYTYMQK